MNKMLTKEEIKEIRKENEFDVMGGYAGYEHVEDAAGNVNALLSHIDALTERLEAMAERIERRWQTENTDIRSNTFWAAGQVRALIEEMKG